MHRDSQKRIIREHLTYFVTTNTRDRIGQFKNEILCDIFVEQLKVAKQIKRFELYGFVILHDHVHLLIKPDINSNISRDIQYLKRHFTRNVNILLGHTEGANGHSRLHGIHNNIDKFVLINRDKLQNQYHMKFHWQKSFHDHYIRNEKDFENHLKYINSNHLKHGLSHNWQYIGYNYPELLDL